MTMDTNLKTYSSPSVISYYSSLVELQPSEAYVFDKYLDHTHSILDIGVGGGRTTYHLTKVSNRYVGIDYSQQMVEATRARFPNTDIRLLDASNMAEFESSTFDRIIFSFNGMDYLPSDEARMSCLRECQRILKPGGLLIFSRHNARVLVTKPVFQNISFLKKTWRLFRAFFKSIQLGLRTVLSKPFWTGAGYIYDPVHGGLKTNVTTPSAVSRELRSAGLMLSEVVAEYYPSKTPHFATPWYYYVARKPT